MVNRAKAKGTRLEVRVVEYLRAHGFPLAERAQSGTKDRGDVSGVDCALGRVVEAKNVQSISLAQFMDEVATEKKNDGAPIGSAVVTHRSHGFERAYAVFELADAVAHLRGERPE